MNGDAGDLSECFENGVKPVEVVVADPIENLLLEVMDNPSCLVAEACSFTGRLDEEAAAVARIGFPPEQPRVFETVEDPGHRRGPIAEHANQVADFAWTIGDQEGQYVPFVPGDTHGDTLLGQSEVELSLCLVDRRDDLEWTHTWESDINSRSNYTRSK